MIALCVCLLLTLTFVKCTENNLSDALKNITQSKNSSSSANDKDENTLKSEVQQFLRECGAGSTDDNSSDQRNRNNGYDYKNRRNTNDDNYNNNNNNRRNSYGSRCNTENSDECDSNNRSDNNSGRQRFNNNNMNNNRRGYSSNYDDERRNGGSGYGSSGSNCNYRSNTNEGADVGGGSGGFWGALGGRNSNSRGGYNNYRDDEGYFNTRQFPNSNRGGNNQDMMYFRTRRSNYDSQCISQCVFGFLEVLGDDRVPSETLLIKWLQDHLTNDVRRIRALREARRCFARLSTTDTDDGCEFSKSLSNCLNLEIE